jgi:hypothetical protein
MDWRPSIFVEREEIIGKEWMDRPPLIDTV